jgi:hypothetical protein
LVAIASCSALVPAGAPAAASKQRACYTATTFRNVDSAKSCRGAEAFISWAKHGLTSQGEVSGGTRPKRVLTVTGDTGAHGPIVPARAVRGARGLSGLRGVAGDSGSQGPQGAQGLQGDTGATGAQGDQGLRGVAGDTGPRGLEGPEGDQGIQGLEGLTGTPGTTGLAGLAGLDGATGATGAQGPAGADGAAGAQGAQGVAGDPGPAGAAGADGAAGLQGPAGEIGPAGPKGDPGTPSGFRKTAAADALLLTDATPLVRVTPAAGAYMGGAATTITGGTIPASVTCTISDGSPTLLGSSTVTVGDGVTASARLSVQLGVFTAPGTELTFACTSDQADAVVAGNTVFAGLSLDAIAETP